RGRLGQGAGGQYGLRRHRGAAAVPPDERISVPGRGVVCERSRPGAVLEGIPDPTGRAPAPAAGEAPMKQRWLALGFAALLVNAGGLVAFPAPTVFYVGNVLLHIG